MSPTARSSRSALVVQQNALRARKSSSLFRCMPVYVVFILSTLLSMMASAAPISKAKHNEDDEFLGSVRDGPYNLSVQAGIAGALLIVGGILLCFFGYRLFHVTMFLIGWYFFANLTYIGMANGGVTSQTWLLVASILVGIVGGLLLVCCSRLGVAILGALALYGFGLWLLSWKSGGLLTTSTGRGILLGALAVVGFLLGCCREKEVVIIGSAILGAFSITIGIDFFAQTGYTREAESFINGRDTFESHFENKTWQQYTLLGGFLLLAILGIIVQWRAFGRRTFRPAPAATPVPNASDPNVVYTEKPSRFGGMRGWFRRGA
ncbi:hypothetical protein BGW42_001930 [Actinomortierella wolfii]|nr:hypothetical protein BGW42_001930 [Actinomortierella wolfii]